MPDFDEVIFGLVGEDAIIGGTEVSGIFHRRYREIQLQDGSIAGLDLSFDCQVTDEVLALVRGDLVVFEGENYPFIQPFPEGGDESGLIILELGRALTT
jgi:hypothetical protein